MAVNGAVPSSLRVHRDVPHRAERQHVGPCVQHFPFQLSTTKSWTQQGKLTCHPAVSFLRHLMLCVFVLFILNSKVDSFWEQLVHYCSWLCPFLSSSLSLWYQDFARSKSISLGRDKVLQFPPVWDWSQQFSLKDQALFNNPLYVGKSAPCVHNGTVRTFIHKRSKVRIEMTGIFHLKIHTASQSSVLLYSNIVWFKNVYINSKILVLVYLTVVWQFIVWKLSKKKIFKWDLYF